MSRLLHQIKVAANLAKPLKLALIVRSDLKLTKGKVAAQCAHAAVICYEQSASSHPELLRLWLASGQPKIVLRVEDLDRLEVLRDTAKEAGLTVGCVRDAGRTQVDAGTVTVLGVGPSYEDQVDAIVKHLKLL